MTSVSNVAHIKIDFFQYWENVANFSQFKRSLKKKKKNRGPGLVAIYSEL